MLYSKSVVMTMVFNPMGVQKTGAARCFVKSILRYTDK